MKTLDWVKWCVATVLAAVTMTTGVIAAVYRTFTPRDLFDLLREDLTHIKATVDEIRRDQINHTK